MSFLRPYHWAEEILALTLSGVDCFLGHLSSHLGKRLGVRKAKVDLSQIVMEKTNTFEGYLFENNCIFKPFKLADTHDNIQVS